MSFPLPGSPWRLPFDHPPLCGVITAVPQPPSLLSRSPPLHPSPTQLADKHHTRVWLKTFWGLPNIFGEKMCFKFFTMSYKAFQSLILSSPSSFIPLFSFLFTLLCCIVTKWNCCVFHQNALLSLTPASCASLALPCPGRSSAKRGCPRTDRSVHAAVTGCWALVFVAFLFFALVSATAPLSTLHTCLWASSTTML